MILKKARSQLAPYFILNILFGLLTTALHHYDINLGDSINWQSLFIAPFDRGDQFNLYLAAWFLLTLFFVNILGILFLQAKKDQIFVFQLFLQL